METLYSLPTSVMNDFHKRFNIEIEMDEARERFIARVCNEIFDALPGAKMFAGLRWQEGAIERYHVIVRAICSRLGKKYEPDGGNSGRTKLDVYIDTEDFWEVLQTVEAIYRVLGDQPLGDFDENINEKVKSILVHSELDIGIRWEDGKFIRTGAELLDNKLVDDPLKWLRHNGHSTVIEPFEKALRHFLEIGSRPEIISDVIQNAYEALEALAKITLDNDRDLSQNREKFVSKIKGKGFHKKILNEYVDYGCKYRHAADPKSPRPQPTVAEAEFFLYFTGTFIRLAMENWEGS